MFGLKRFKRKNDELTEVEVTPDNWVMGVVRCCREWNVIRGVYVDGELFAFRMGHCGHCGEVPE